MANYTLDYLIDNAQNNGGHVNCEWIELGVGPRYHASTDEHGRRVEVWLHLEKPLDGWLEELAMKADDIDPNDRFYNGKYDYHMPYFPVAWLDDMWSELGQYAQKPAKVAKDESLMEFALNHGCHFMDMNTMKIYKRV